MESDAASKKLHIVMFPWLAYGHIIPYLHLANNLAENGLQITFLLPKKAKKHFEPSNLHPSLITFHPIAVPHVDPLPPGTETTADIHISLHNHLASALDRTRPMVESILASLNPRPDFIFYDMAHWIPESAAMLGIKSVFYVITCALSVAGFMSSDSERPITMPEWAPKPDAEFGDGVTLAQRVKRELAYSDAMAVRTCLEIEEASCNLLMTRYDKPVLLTGPSLPELEPADTHIEARWDEWLGRFGPRSVIFCCFGSQYVLDKAQFQDLALGLEMTQLPFLMVVKPPDGHPALEALPEGYMERVRDRGVVYDGWVQQTQILAHQSVGCFVTHCGFGSTWEGLVCESQLVLVPQLNDQIMNAEMMAGQLQVGVMAKREKDGRMSKRSLCEAIKSVMDEDSEIGAVVKKNHAILKQKLQKEGLMSAYIDNFVKGLLAL